MADVKDTKDKADFTAREMEIMTLAWTCMTEEPKVDYAKLAEACSMKNPRSASNAWTSIKKKIVAKAGIVKDAAKCDGGEGSASPTKKTPKSTPRKRAKKGEAAGETNGDEKEGEDTPAKKKIKATPKGKTGKVKSEPEVEEDGEGTGEGEDVVSPVKEEEQD